MSGRPFRSLCALCHTAFVEDGNAARQKPRETIVRALVLHRERRQEPRLMFRRPPPHSFDDFSRVTHAPTPLKLVRVVRRGGLVAVCEPRAQLLMCDQLPCNTR